MGLFPFETWRPAGDIQDELGTAVSLFLFGGQTLEAEGCDSTEETPEGSLSGVCWPRVSDAGWPPAFAGKVGVPWAVGYVLLSLKLDTSQKRKQNMPSSGVISSWGGAMLA